MRKNTTVKALLVTPLVAGLLTLGLAGCSTTAQSSDQGAQAPADTPRAAATASMAANLPNDYSSPTAVAESMFRDMQARDGAKYAALFDKEHEARFKAGLIQSAALAEVSPYTDFKVTSVSPGWAGKPSSTEAAVYYTVMYKGQLQQNILNATMDDPQYAPNVWHLGYNSYPQEFDHAWANADGDDKSIDATLSGSGKSLDFKANDNKILYLFPGQYTLKAALDDSYQVSGTVATRTVNLLPQQ